MANLQQFPAKICLTASSCLVLNDRVLLVKHKKLGIWLCPGGHVEENELPHHTAEREFWEETNIKVRVIGTGNDRAGTGGDGDEFVPSPILTNLHWVSKANFDARQSNPEKYQTQPQWARGCEQHYNFYYVVVPVDAQQVEFEKNVEETDGIAWFTQTELDALNLNESIRHEIETVFAFWNTQHRKKE